MSSSSSYRPPSHRGPLASWPEADYDAALHLLDRQVVDVEGRLVGKVDDLELTESVDGSLVPTGLLIGLGALLPRFGDRLGSWLGERHRQLQPSRADHGAPGVVELDLVADVTSEVQLSVPRDGLVRRRVEDPRTAPVRRLLGDLLAMRVLLPGGPVAGDRLRVRGSVRVLDVRLSGSPEGPGRHRVAALVVGHGRPGSLFGYDRSREQGPWLVAGAVRWLHRHSVVVELGRAVDLVWAAGEVRVGSDATVRPLRE